VCIFILLVRQKVCIYSTFTECMHPYKMISPVYLYVSVYVCVYVCACACVCVCVCVWVSAF